MIMTEKYHACIVLEFYKELKKRKGDLGVEIFITLPECMVKSGATEWL